MKKESKVSSSKLESSKSESEDVENELLKRFQDSQKDGSSNSFEGLLDFVKDPTKLKSLNSEDLAKIQDSGILNNLSSILEELKPRKLDPHSFQQIQLAEANLTQMYTELGRIQVHASSLINKIQFLEDEKSKFMKDLAHQFGIPSGAKWGIDPNTGNIVVEK